MHAARSSDHEPAARTIGVDDLKVKADVIIREVSETGLPVDIVRDGQIAARLLPAPQAEPAHAFSMSAEEREQAVREWRREMDRVSRDLAAVWPKGVSARDVVDDIRGPR